MSYFLVKGALVEAMQLPAVDASASPALVEWVQAHVKSQWVFTGSHGEIEIHSADGAHKTQPGDWLVMDASGNLQLCKPEHFLSIYGPEVAPPQDALDAPRDLAVVEHELEGTAVELHEALAHNTELAARVEKAEHDSAVAQQLLPVPEVAPKIDFDAKPEIQMLRVSAPSSETDDARRYRCLRRYIVQVYQSEGGEAGGSRLLLSGSEASLDSAIDAYVAASP
jgi:hypothetical protein